ncbi:MAG: MBL fold metallo-hydrolase [Lachnospiraceae bacterium]|nr:MBL fold metallo-hydrolase [Lachnospiraceae bacterium]
MFEEITKDILAVGVNDPNTTKFENQYDLPEGMAYNSYLIMDEKVCLMDSVDADVTDEWLNNVKEALNGRSIDYIVVQHMEPDHSGSLEAIIAAYPDMRIVTSAQALKMMGAFFDKDYSDKVDIVKENDTLSLGKHELTFVAAPMVHWPEVIMTYDKTDKVLFSADAFGKFGVRESEPDDWACEARRYYFNIVGKFGVQVQNLLKKVSAFDIEKICSLHGPYLPQNEDLAFYLDKYEKWSSYTPEDQGVAVIYASIHGCGTKEAALYISEQLEAKGIKAPVTDICNDDIHEGVEDAFRYDRMVVCASSYDADLFTPMTTFLEILRMKNYQNRKVGIIENGAWAPTAGRVMKSKLEAFKNVEIIEPMVTVRASLKDDSKAAIDELVAHLS